MFSFPVMPSCLRGQGRHGSARVHEKQVVLSAITMSFTHIPRLLLLPCSFQSDTAAAVKHLTAKRALEIACASASPVTSHENSRPQTSPADRSCYTRQHPSYVYTKTERRLSPLQKYSAVPQNRALFHTPLLPM